MATTWTGDDKLAGQTPLTYNQAGKTYNQASVQYNGKEQTQWTNDSKS